MEDSKPQTTETSNVARQQWDVEVAVGKFDPKSPSKNYNDSDPKGSGWKDGAVGAKIGEILRSVWDALAGFETKKGHFLVNAVQTLNEQYPGMNVVVFHDQATEYMFFNGAHAHLECYGVWGLESWGVEAWVFESGYVHHNGDGGYENWSFCGRCYRPDPRGPWVVWTSCLHQDGGTDAKELWEGLFKEFLNEKGLFNPFALTNYKNMLRDAFAKDATRFNPAWYDSHNWGPGDSEPTRVLPYRYDPDPEDLEGGQKHPWDKPGGHGGGRI